MIGLEISSREKERDRMKELQKASIATQAKRSEIERDPFKALPTLAKEEASAKIKDASTKESIANEIESVVAQLTDPKLGRDQKIVVGKNALKLLNSTAGKDAVGSEEAERLAEFLEWSFGLNPGGARALGDAGINIEGFAEQAANTAIRVREAAMKNKQDVGAIFQANGLDSPYNFAPQKGGASGKWGGDVGHMSPEFQKEYLELKKKSGEQ
jgi:hypothetical protein